MTRVYICIGCGLLDLAERSDRLACSTACRVRAHRTGVLRNLRARAAELDIAPRLILEAFALRVLTPDLFDTVHAGRLTLDDVQPQLRNAFDDVLRAQLGGAA